MHRRFLVNSIIILWSQLYIIDIIFFSLIVLKLLIRFFTFIVFFLIIQLKFDIIFV